MDGWVGQGTQHAALYNIIQDYIAARCEKHAQGFYTAATWRGIVIDLDSEIIGLAGANRTADVLHHEYTVRFENRELPLSAVIQI